VAAETGLNFLDHGHHTVAVVEWPAGQHADINHRIGCRVARAAPLQLGQLHVDLAVARIGVGRGHRRTHIPITKAANGISFLIAGSWTCPYSGTMRNGRVPNIFQDIRLSVVVLLFQIDVVRFSWHQVAIPETLRRSTGNTSEDAVPTHAQYLRGSRRKTATIGSLTIGLASKRHDLGAV
jgi:hypothetical protein